MKRKLLTQFVRETASTLEDEGHYGTAHIYRSTANSFDKYMAETQSRAGKPAVTLHSVSAGLLKGYERWLRCRGRSWNTVGTYMHTLRACYNRGVSAGCAPCVPRLFSGVFTGRSSERKRALDARSVRTLLTDNAGELPPDMERARAFGELMFRFRGLSFVDLAHLQKSDYRHGRLVLRRRKTGREVSIAVDARAAVLLERHAAPASSPYLLDILPEGMRGKSLYAAYQCRLHAFNLLLGRLSAFRKVGERVTSYSMRHTWATQSKYCGIPLPVISEGLGHSSVRTTEIYLKRYDHSLLDRANNLTVKYVLEGVLKRFRLR